MFCSVFPRLGQAVLKRVRWRGSAGADEVVFQPLHLAESVVEPGGSPAIAVFLARIQDEADGGLVAHFQVPVEFARLADVDARVVLAMQDQDGRPGVGSVVNGATFQKELPRFPRALPCVDVILFVRDVGRADRQNRGARECCESGGEERGIHRRTLHSMGAASSRFQAFLRFDRGRAVVGAECRRPIHPPTRFARSCPF